MCIRIDGIKVMSPGISGGKQVIQFANTCSRGGVCLCMRQRCYSCKMYSSSFDKFYCIIVHCEDMYGHCCIQKGNNIITYTTIIFVFKIKVLNVLLSKINKLNNNFFYFLEFYHLFVPWETMWHGFYPTAYDDGVYCEKGLFECLILVGCMLALKWSLTSFLLAQKEVEILWGNFVMG